MKRLLTMVLTTLAVLLVSAQAMAATCSVSEFSALVTDFGGNPIQIPKVNGSGPTTQTVSATTPTAVSNAFASGARFLWIYCDEVMHFQLGTSPATGLTTGDMRIPAGGFWIGLPNEVALGTLKIAFCDADCS